MTSLVNKAGPFCEFAPVYRRLGMWPRPVVPGSKACYLREWTRSDTAIEPDVLQQWLRDYGHQGIGLLMGSPLPDGTTLGALDIDRDEYFQLGRAILRDPVCGRFGSKGGVFFVRVAGNLDNPQFKVAGAVGGGWGRVAECLFFHKLCVIPPTIHPTTDQPYRWIGTPLHELNDFLELPLVGA